MSTPNAVTTFSAIIDTGGPITVVAREVLAAGGDPVDVGRTMVLRLGGSTAEVPLYELTLEARPPRELTSGSAVAWRALVAVQFSCPALSIGFEGCSRIGGMVGELLGGPCVWSVLGG